MKKIKLGDVCKFVEERISVSVLDKSNYISTENLLPNKNGITFANSLPPAENTKKFCSGDILISNIRPYFKKIWYAIFDGGCSNDIFVLRANNNIYPKFLYYALSEDNFFDFATKSAKGTKMPRGNKNSLINYPIPILSLEVQKQIGNFLYSLDQKISLNKKINATLEEMAKTIFLHKFFRKPTNGKISDILVENEKSAISVGEAKNSGGDFPFFTSGENILRWNEKLVDGRNIFLNDGGNVGIKFYVGAAAYSTHTYCITAKDNFADFLYLTLKIFESEIEKRFFTGTGLKNLRKDLLKDFAIYIPTQAELKNFNSAVQPCFDTISKNFRENNLLENLRDFLLPMLMNEQVAFDN